MKIIQKLLFEDKNNILYNTYLLYLKHIIG